MINLDTLKIVSILNILASYTAEKEKIRPLSTAKENEKNDRYLFYDDKNPADNLDEPNETLYPLIQFSSFFDSRFQYIYCDSNGNWDVDGFESVLYKPKYNEIHIVFDDNKVETECDEGDLMRIAIIKDGFWEII